MSFMPALLTLLPYVLKGLLFLTAIAVVGVWWASFNLRKRLRGHLFRWEKPSFGLWTAILFLLGLIFLSGGMLAYAFAVRLTESPPLILFWKEIAALSLLEVSLLVLLYAGLRAHHLYVLSDRGIYNIRFCWKRFVWEVELIPWEAVYDYYTHEEGALFRFTLLLRNRQQVVLEVPMHLRELVERVIVLGKEKYGFLYKYGQQIRRYSSES